MVQWLKEAIIYHIFVDRFDGFKKNANDLKPEFCEGKIRAVTKRLDYIKGLGFNTIWISPFYESYSYHGYNITDFKKVNPNFGTYSDIKELIHACKNKGLRVITDIVPNHCSYKHNWFLEAQSDKNSEFLNWFYFNKWPDAYLSFLSFKDLPKINLENLRTQEYFLEVFSCWAALGFDGFRIDHVIGIPDKFLHKLTTRLKQQNAEFALIGEAWGEGLKYKHLKTLRLRGRYSIWEKGFNQINIQKAYTDILDGVLDFGWRDTLLKHFQLIQMNKKKLWKVLDSYSALFSENICLLRFLDNHDTNRIMFYCKDQTSIFKQSLELLYKQNQPVIVYYGTEAGLTHMNKVSPLDAHSDLYARRFMEWSDYPTYGKFLSELAEQRKVKN